MLNYWELPVRALLIGETSRDLARVGRTLADHGWQVEQERWLDPDQIPAIARSLDLIVAGVTLVDEGLGELLQQIRQAGCDAIVIVLGEFSVEERIRALNAGADEFLRRESPGAMLLGRVLALLRLRSGRFKSHFQLGDLQLDLIHRQVNRAGREISLSKREFQLLVLLAQHAGQTVSRSLLIEQLWGQSQGPDDNTLDTYVSRLRRKLDGPFSEKLVATVRGVGYRLVAVR